MCGPSHVQPEGNGPDHTAHTKSNEKATREERGEERGGEREEGKKA